jgi:hypothetical protein
MPKRSAIRESTYWTMSGRIGDLKTLGSGWVLSLGFPFGPMMLTTGLLVISRTEEMT